MPTPCTPTIETNWDEFGVQKKTTTFENFGVITEPVSDKQTTLTERIEGSEAGKYTWVREEIIQTGVTHWSIEVTSGTEPIETNVRYSGAFLEDWQKEELRKWKIWKGNPSDTEVLNWDPSTSPSWAIVELYDYWKKGITDYYEPKVTLKREVLEEFPPLLDGIGLIEPASIYPGTTNFGNRTFLFTGASSKQLTPKYWQNSYEYLLSGPLGWDINLYSGEEG